MNLEHVAPGPTGRLAICGRAAMWHGRSSPCLSANPCRGIPARRLIGGPVLFADDLLDFSARFDGDHRVEVRLGDLAVDSGLLPLGLLGGREYSTAGAHERD